MEIHLKNIVLTSATFTRWLWNLRNMRAGCWTVLLASSAVEESKPAETLSANMEMMKAWIKLYWERSGLVPCCMTLDILLQTKIYFPHMFFFFSIIKVTAYYKTWGSLILALHSNCESFFFKKKALDFKTLYSS